MDNLGPSPPVCHGVRMTQMPLIDPMLNPAARLLWRGRRVVQIELGDRAVTVDGIDPAVVRRLVQQRPAGGGPAPVPDESVRLAFGTLADAGFLWERSSDDDDLRLAPPVPRLAGELGALTARHGERAAEVLNARRHYTVALHGDGRAGPHIASLLAAAGIGRIDVTHAGDVRLRHASPGGVSPSDEGTSFRGAVEAAVRRAAPEADTTALPLGERPDLVILAVDEPIDTERRDALHARNCPHLGVRLGPDFGVVGPLVLPGLTSCLHCADLHRLDRDPAWSALAVQLGVPTRHTPASDVSLTAVIAGMAAMQALCYLDGVPAATVDGTLELHLPDWQPRRRSWPVHPDCDCSR